MRRLIERVLGAFGRIGVRLLIVNTVVLLVPVAGLEFARLYERQLLSSLERDMRNQSALLRATIEAEVSSGADPAAVLTRFEPVIVASARSTRTRVRLLDASGEVLADSHREGPPEGPEPEPPRMLPSPSTTRGDGPRWPSIPERTEVARARAGVLATHTRVRGRSPAVLLFLAEPVMARSAVIGVVYVTRSTQPVLVELHRIRTGLTQVLIVALAVTALVTLLLAYSLSRPIVKLARAARRVAGGELDVDIPVTGSGEIKDLGEAFRTMKERLLGRLRFARDFSADVAHELKSPLTSIRGAAELLADQPTMDAEQRARFSQNILADTERLDRLVTRLLDLGRVEAAEGKPEPVDLAALLQGAATRVDPEHRRVVVTLPEVIPSFRGRPADLEAAIVNLLENALRESGDAEVSLALEVSPQALAIRVHDEGPGIPSQHRAKLFERFYTTRSEAGGTGLGLPIVRSVAETHGGRVTLTAEPGTGTTFSLELPRRS